MNCEQCGKEVHRCFGFDIDYCIYDSVEYPDGKMKLTEHKVCIECYAKIMDKSQKRYTILT